jgi:hypothetical protein
MDPDAALQAIDDADRVDAETREVMNGLHAWLSRGGFSPDWSRYPKGARRFRKAYGQQRGMASPSTRSHATRSHATRSHATKKLTSRIAHSTIQIGDIVQRSDIAGRNRYVVVNIHSPWIYTRRVSGSGGPGIVTFPSEYMLRKVA